MRLKKTFAISMFTLSQRTSKAYLKAVIVKV